MKTDVQVTITGLPFTNAAVTGVTVTYGINMIPYAVIALDAPMLHQQAPDFLCNPDKYKTRDKLVTIRVESITGCLSFNGYFDGLNISQSVGSFTYSAVIKNRFQRLMEIYPKVIGLMPGSFQPFRSQEQFRTEQGDTNILLQSIKINTQAAADTDKSIGEFAIEFFKLLVKSQLQYVNSINTEEDINRLFSIMNDEIYKKNLQIGTQLLDKVDVTYIKDCEVSARIAGLSIVDLAIRQMNHLWGLMVDVFEYMGCVLLCGDNNIYVVPQAAFMKLTHAKPKFQEQSDVPNTANPADYNGFSVTDSGLVNVKYSYVVIDQSILLSTPSSKFLPIVTQYMGVYPPKGGADPELPDDGASGILITTASPAWSRGILYSQQSNKNVQSDISGGKPYAAARVNKPSETKDKGQKVMDQDQQLMDRAKVLLDAFAKLKFLQAKYNDRTGGFSTVFNPNWCPGTTGSLYVRLPGLFSQFYVTNVSHTIQLMAPNNGIAVTSVQFASARYGTEGAVPGVKSDDLFHYDTGKMTQLQKAFIADITN